MAELVDALVSKTSPRKGVRVQLPLPAQAKNQTAWASVQLFKLTGNR